MATLVVLLVLLAPAASGSEVLQRHPGENVTLSCRVDGGVSIRAVEWTRDDLETPKYVLLHRDGRSDPTNQHPSFKGRVDLVDDELKDGDVSLILRNISVNDKGTYECRVAVGGSGRKKRAVLKTAPIRTIQLVVTDPGSKNEEPPDGNNNHVLAAVFGSVCLAIVVVVIVVVRKHKTCKQQIRSASCCCSSG